MVFVIEFSTKGLSFVERTRLRYKLFGRIVKVRDNHYYYPGLLDDVKFSKINRNTILVSNPIKIPDDLKNIISTRLEAKDFDFKNCRTGKEVLIGNGLMNGFSFSNVTQDELLLDGIL